MRLRLDHRMHRILRHLPRQGGYRIAETMLLGALAIQCARLVWIVLTPVGPAGDWRPENRTAAIAAQAQSLFSSFDPFFRAEQSGSAVVTSLQLTLFGTRIDEVSGQGSAIIAGADDQQNSYGVGDEIMPGVILKSVAFDSVTIERGGALEQLFLDQSAPIDESRESDEGYASIETDGSLADEQASGDSGLSVEQLRSGITFLPRRENGRTTGLVLRGVGDSSVFRTAGFREGDMLVEVNGGPISNAADVQRAFAQATPGSKLSATVERGADILPIAISIAR